MEMGFLDFVLKANLGAATTQDYHADHADRGAPGGLFATALSKLLGESQGKGVFADASLTGPLDDETLSAPLVSRIPLATKSDLVKGKLVFAGPSAEAEERAEELVSPFDEESESDEVCPSSLPAPRLDDVQSQSVTQNASLKDMARLTDGAVDHVGQDEPQNHVIAEKQRSLHAPENRQNAMIGRLFFSEPAFRESVETHLESSEYTRAEPLVIRESQVKLQGQESSLFVDRVPNKASHAGLGLLTKSQSAVYDQQETALVTRLDLTELLNEDLKWRGSAKPPVPNAANSLLEQLSPAAAKGKTSPYDALQQALSDQPIGRQFSESDTLFSRSIEGTMTKAALQTPGLLEGYVKLEDSLSQQYPASRRPGEQFHPKGPAASFGSHTARTGDSTMHNMPQLLRHSSLHGEEQQGKLPQAAKPYSNLQQTVSEVPASFRHSPGQGERQGELLQVAEPYSNLQQTVSEVPASFRHSPGQGERQGKLLRVAEPQNNLQQNVSAVPELNFPVSSQAESAAIISGVPTSPPPVADSVMDQLVRGMDVELTKTGGEVIIQLKPDSLGEVSVRVSVEQGIISAQFAAESLQVKEIINSQLVQLRMSLEEMGLDVGEFSVDVQTSEHQQPQQDADHRRSYGPGETADGSDTPSAEKVPRSAAIGVYRQLGLSTVDMQA